VTSLHRTKARNPPTINGFAISRVRKGVAMHLSISWIPLEHEAYRNLRYLHIEI
jgi:hypothetical protein